MLDRTSGRTLRIRAAYVVAADGGKTVSRLLGIGMTGTPTFLEWVNLHVRADFSPFIPATTRWSTGCRACPPRAPWSTAGWCPWGRPGGAATPRSGR
ncbi:hypothetical protein GXW82_13020 [Streptacidiphilus sp. 4-A2]|nr:hypothetical protein [Streptacidiphilus sp. 4-A2]